MVMAVAALAAAALAALVGCCFALRCHRRSVARKRAVAGVRSLELGVSIRYILDDFAKEVARDVGGGDPDFYEIAPRLLYGPAARGFGRICPRDRKPHCSFVDALPKQDSAKATVFLSWVWSYKAGMFVDCLAQWVLLKKDSKRDGVFLWVCAFCNNQFRLLDAKSANGSDNLEVVFLARVHQIGHMLAMWNHWNRPHYLERIWCIYEQFTAIQMGIEADIIMPFHAILDFRMKMTEDNPMHIFKDALSAIDSVNARATVMADEIKVKHLINTGIGFDATNERVRGRLEEWFSEQFVQHIHPRMKRTASL